MDHLVPARLLVDELVKEGALESRRPELVARDLAKHLEALGRLPSADELEEWLEGHRLVSELYANAGTLEELIHRHFSRPARQASEERVEEGAPAREARDPELEALLREAPDDVERHLVYSDWLQEHGDPLGELIALGVAADRGGADAQARFERHLRSHEDRFLGGLARRFPPEVTLRWRCGLVRAIEASWNVDASVWRQLLELRICGLLRELKVSLRGSHGAALADVLSALVARAARSLRVLELEGFYELQLPEALLRRPPAELALHGDTVILPAGLPGTIERLRLRVFRITSPEHARRWELRRLDTNLELQVAELLPELALPQLERLTLDLRRCAPHTLVGVLERLNAPALTHLELCGGPLASETFSTLATLPLARKLSSLALTALELGDAAMLALASEQHRFPALARLDVSGNELTREGLEAARRLAPEVVSQRQERPGSGALERLRSFAGSRLEAAEKIAEPKAWRDAGVEGDTLWARYRGNAEYELFVTRGLDAYGCTCPSSIQPCKHVVALALVARKVELPERPSGGILGRVHRLEHR
jgi:uncharacterized protein (TIGR02996 family)